MWVIISWAAQEDERERARLIRVAKGRADRRALRRPRREIARSPACVPFPHLVRVFITLSNLNNTVQHENGSVIGASEDQNVLKLRAPVVKHFLHLDRSQHRHEDQEKFTGREGESETTNVTRKVTAGNFQFSGRTHLQRHCLSGPEISPFVEPAVNDEVHAVQACEDCKGKGGKKKTSRVLKFEFAAIKPRKTSKIDQKRGAVDSCF